MSPVPFGQSKVDYCLGRVESCGVQKEGSQVLKPDCPFSFALTLWLTLNCPSTLGISFKFGVCLFDEIRSTTGPQLPPQHTFHSRM